MNFSDFVKALFTEDLDALSLPKDRKNVKQ